MLIRWSGLLLLTAVATLGLETLSVPSAALFAGLVVAAVLALSGLAPRATGDGPPMPKRFGLAAQGILGVYIGTMVSPDVLTGLGSAWVPVVVVAMGTLALSVLGGALLGLHSKVDSLTGSLALVAGGASGLVALTRELGGDERMVAVIQYVRVGLVTVTMPIVATVVFNAHTGGGSGSQNTIATATLGSDTLVSQLWGLLLTAVCIALGSTVGRLVKLPAAGLLGPLVMSVIAELTGISASAAVPMLLVTLGYAVIGWQAGLGFTIESLRAIGRVLPYAVGLIIAIGLGSAGLGVLLSLWTGESMFDSYLATTPGGIYAVLAAAAAAGSNITFVVAAQIVRVLLMLFIAPLAARLHHRFRTRHDVDDPSAPVPATAGVEH